MDGRTRQLIYKIGVIFQALQIIFEMQSQGSNQKRALMKIYIFKLQTCFSYFFLILTPLLFSIFLFVLNNLKCFRNVHLEVLQIIFEL
jgi:hypothetical protein